MKIFGKDDSAVASAVGAILLTGILFSFLVLVRISYVPVWEADVESIHMSDVESDMSRLGAGLLSSNTLGSAASFSQPFTLTPTHQVFMGPIRPAGELGTSIVPDALRFDASTMNIFERDGKTVAAGSNQWEPVAAGNSIDGITDLRSLRIRIEDLGPVDEGTTFNLIMTNEDGANLGRLSGLISAAGTSGTVMTIDVSVIDASGATIGKRTDNVGVDVGGGIYFLNALDPDLQFTSLLAPGVSQFSLDIAQESGALNPLSGPTTGIVGGATFSYTAAYDQVNPDGTTTSVNPGTPVSPYSESIDLTKISYRYPSQYAVDQDIVLEFGAVVLTQPDGQIVRAAPGLQIYRAGSDLAINIDAAGGFTSETSAVGDRTAIIKAQRQGLNSWSGSTSEVTMTLATQAPQAWAAHWQWAIEKAGFGDGFGGVPGIQVATIDGGISITLSASGVDAAANFDNIIIRMASPQFALEVE